MIIGNQVEGLLEKNTQGETAMLRCSFCLLCAEKKAAPHWRRSHRAPDLVIPTDDRLDIIIRVIRIGLKDGTRLN